MPAVFGKIEAILTGVKLVGIDGMQRRAPKMLIKYNCFMGDGWTDSYCKRENSEGKIEILTAVKTLNKDNFENQCKTTSYRSQYLIFFFFLETHGYIFWKTIKNYF